MNNFIGCSYYMVNKINILVLSLLFSFLMSSCKKEYTPNSSINSFLDNYGNNVDTIPSCNAIYSKRLKGLWLEGYSLDSINKNVTILAKLSESIYDTYNTNDMNKYHVYLAETEKTDTETASNNFLKLDQTVQMQIITEIKVLLDIFHQYKIDSLFSHQPNYIRIIFNSPNDSYVCLIHLSKDFNADSFNNHKLNALNPNFDIITEVQKAKRIDAFDGRWYYIDE